MHITHLSLTNFRNYHRLELDLPPSPIVIQGANAQGKTNLLESVYLLSTTKSHRASTDRELLHHDAMSDDISVARLSADTQRVRGNAKVEVSLRVDKTVQPTTPGATDPMIPLFPLRKQVRVNGVVCRSTDFVGQINVAMFTAQDIDLVAGRPALCRRYLDQINCQLDPLYLRALQRYQRVLTQRNHLLRQLQGDQAQPDQLDFWNNELVQSGSYLIVQRRSLIRELNGLAGDIHREVSDSTENLRIAYAPNITADGGLPEIEAGFRDALHKGRREEFLQGMTLAGPHRDNLQFLVNGCDVAAFASRGQQQTVVLALKLAQAKHMQVKVNDCPVLLLDDVFSELDLQRRQHLLALVTQYQQVLITAIELDYFDPSFLAVAARFRVSQGDIEPA